MLSIIVAAADNGVIGNSNQLPWRLPDDLKRFKALSLGKPVVMGRKTFDSIGKPLPGRLNIIVSRQVGLQIPGCVVVDSLEQAIAAAQPAKSSTGDDAAKSLSREIVIVGGADIYAQALPQVGTIHLTRVHATVPGDVYFPQLAQNEWREVATEYHPADERHAYAFTFSTLQRVAP